MRLRLLGLIAASGLVGCGGLLGITQLDDSPDGSIDAGVDARAWDGAGGGDAADAGADVSDAARDVSDVTSDASGDASDAADASDVAVVPPCLAGAQRCAGQSAVQVCGSSGTWGEPVACASDVPVCSAGSCLAPSNDGGVALPLSCQPGGAGMSNCGPGGAGVESCCASLEVPGGTFYRTYDPVSEDGGVAVLEDGGPTGEADPATIHGFRLDRYEVTVGRFRQYVQSWHATGGPPAASGKHVHLNGGQGLANSGDPGTFETGWVASDDMYLSSSDSSLNCVPFPTWTSQPGSQENLPINCVSWWEAYAFCIWDGGFLPSTTEWEFAAAGGSEQREYPWGSADPGSSSDYAIYGCLYQGSGVCTGVENLAQVGTAKKGVGLWGQFDLAGNLFEWTLDWKATYVDPCIDCAFLTAQDGRMTPGGAFSYDRGDLVAPTENWTDESKRFDYLGFRCARVP